MKCRSLSSLVYLLALINLGLLLPAGLCAQVEEQDTASLRIEFNMGLGGITTEYPFPTDIQLDDYIAFRRQLSSNTTFFTGELTDQPYEHGALYATLSSKTTFKPGYRFYVNLMMEHRGESYGANDLRNIVVVPQLYGGINDTIQAFQRPLAISFHIGDLLNYRLNNGLQIYNLDIQGVILSLSSGDYEFEVVHLPDVSKGIGLALEEAFSFNLHRRFGRHRATFSFDLNSNIQPTGDNRYYQHLSLGYNYYSEAGNEVYFQFGSRALEEQFALSSSAFVLGARWQLPLGKWNISFVPELRYYTEDYNEGYLDYSVSYRDKSILEHYGNTVGRYLYPLKNYFYPFSQWAVFTEYANTPVAGISVNTNWEYHLGEHWDTELQLEALWLKSRLSDFTHLFYSWTFNYRVFDDLKVGVLLTNKTMNLDLHFQTFYQTRYPSLNLYLRKDLVPYW